MKTVTREQFEQFLFSESQPDNFTSSQFSIEIVIKTMAHNIWKTFLDEYTNPNYYVKNTTHDEIIESASFLFWEELKIINYDENRTSCEELEALWVHNNTNHIDNELDTRPKFPDFKDNLNFIKILTLVGSYLVDTIEEYLLNANSPKVMAHFTKASYYLGFVHGIYSKQLEKSIQGKVSKQAQTEQNEKIKMENKIIAKKIWESKKWKNKTECVTYIYDNKLLSYDKGYRNIESLVSEIVREQKTNGDPNCTN